MTRSSDRAGLGSDLCFLERSSVLLVRTWCGNAGVCAAPVGRSLLGTRTGLESTVPPPPPGRVCPFDEGRELLPFGLTTFLLNRPAMLRNPSGMFARDALFTELLMKRRYEDLGPGVVMIFSQCFGGLKLEVTGTLADSIKHTQSSRQATKARRSRIGQHLRKA